MIAPPERDRAAALLAEDVPLPSRLGRHDPAQRRRPRGAGAGCGRAGRVGQRDRGLLRYRAVVPRQPALGVGPLRPERPRARGRCRSGCCRSPVSSLSTVAVSVVASRRRALVDVGARDRAPAREPLACSARSGSCSSSLLDQVSLFTTARSPEGAPSHEPCISPPRVDDSVALERRRPSPPPPERRRSRRRAAVARAGHRPGVGPARAAPAARASPPCSTSGTSARRAGRTRTTRRRCRPGTKSWKAFFFGSTDASNFITVDKTPASLWVMEISGRIFGVNAWSVLVPQALEGVAAVGILFATVKRWFSPAAGADRGRGVRAHARRGADVPLQQPRRAARAAPRRAARTR